MLIGTKLGHDDAGLVLTTAAGIEPDDDAPEFRRSIDAGEIKLVSVPEGVRSVFELVISGRKALARLARFSDVLPRVTTKSLPSRAIKSRMSLVGRGVVVTTQRGHRPGARRA